MAQEPHHSDQPADQQAGATPPPFASVVPVLGYRPPDQDRPGGGVPYWVQALIGFIAAGLTIPTTGGMTVGLMAAMGERNAAAAFVVSIVLSLLLVIGLALILRAKARWRGFMLGMLIGFGTIGLAAGACFAMFSRW